MTEYYQQRMYATVWIVHRVLKNDNTVYIHWNNITSNTQKQNFSGLQPIMKEN